MTLFDTFTMAEADTQLPTQPPPKADLEETWAFLYVGIDRLFTEGLDHFDYMRLYSTIYSYCTSLPDAREYSNLG